MSIHRTRDFCAINAQKLEVKFSQPVKDGANAGEAELNTNYNVVKKSDGVALTNTSFTPVLSDDGKVVTLALGAVLDGDYVVTVKPIQSEDVVTDLTPFYTQDLSFSDTVKPTVTGVSYPYAGVAEIQMSEEITLGTETITRVDGETNSGAAATAALDTKDASKIIVSNIEANVEYKVVILGAKDMSGNIITPNPTTVTVKSTIVDTVDPKVESVKATGLDSLEIKFSEPLKVTGSVSGSLDTRYAVVEIGGSALTAATQKFDKDTNTLTVTDMVGTGVGAGIKKVEVKTFNDLAGNTGVTYTNNLVEFKAAVPVLKKTTVAADNQSVTLTFDTPVTLGSGTEFKFTHVDKDMITKDFEVKKADITGSTTKELKLVPKLSPNSSTADGFIVGNYTMTLKTAEIAELTGTNKIDVAFEIKAPVDTEKGFPRITSVDFEEVVINYFDAATGGSSKNMGASAIDVNNYKVEGNAVFEKAIFAGNAHTVKLTLKPGVILANGDYELTISPAVKTQAGVAIDAFAKVHNFEENVVPTVKKATLTDDQTIRVTFSEVLEEYTADPFEVYVDGEIVTGLATIAVKANGGTDSYIDIDLAVGNKITDLSKPITVKIKKLAVIKDANGNELVTEGVYPVVVTP